MPPEVRPVPRSRPESPGRPRPRSVPPPVRVAWGITGTLFLVALLFTLSPALDVALSARFYSPEDGWRFKHAPLWRAFYRWGPLPGVVSGVSGVGLLVAGGVRRNTHLLRVGLFLAGVLLVGPGVLGNSIKPLWGRPRPRQLVTFGGTRHYTPVWDIRPGRKGTSFPSGHVCTAFSLGAPCLLVAHPGTRALMVGATLVYGTLMAVARVAQGAHFPSDAAWSAALAWLAISLVGTLTLGAPHWTGRRGGLPSTAAARAP